MVLPSSEGLPIPMKPLRRLLRKDLSSCFLLPRVIDCGLLSMCPSAERYDPLTGTWTSITAMSTRRRYVRVATLGKAGISRKSCSFKGARGCGILRNGYRSSPTYDSLLSDHLYSQRHWKKTGVGPFVTPTAVAVSPCGHVIKIRTQGTASLNDREKCGKNTWVSQRTTRMTYDLISSLRPNFDCNSRCPGVLLLQAAFSSPPPSSSPSKMATSTLLEDTTVRRTWQPWRSMNRR